MSEPYVTRARPGAGLAVDAGLAAVGRSWPDRSGSVHEGLGLVGSSARATPAVTETIMTRPAAGLGLPAMVGWHSHAFAVTRAPGVGHLVELATGASTTRPALDGVDSPGVIGTQLHGPLLALNPELADLVLARALRVPGWDPLPSPSVETARARRIAELTGQTRSPQGR